MLETNIILTDKSNNLIFVAPREAMRSIMERGIRPPSQVRELIEAGELSPEMIGISYRGFDASHFPEYVSMLEGEDYAQAVSTQIRESRHRFIYSITH